MVTIDYAYISSLREKLRLDLQILHRKIDEIERLRYFEDEIMLSPEEMPSGMEVHVGLIAELVENVKAALMADLPIVSYKPHRLGAAAQRNATKREKFMQAFLKWINWPAPVISELADAQVSLGIGILKGYVNDWPVEERKRKAGESDRAYLNRQRALKKYWGPPFGAVTVHPLSFFFRPASGCRVAEAIEHSYKYRLDSEGLSVNRTDDASPSTLMSSSGQADSTIRPMPAGTDLTSMLLVDEYYNRNRYQLYGDGGLMYDTDQPPVCYFIASGRTSSSKDPDKWAISVAEPLRPNEPIINRSLTRMAEAVDLMVKRRLALVLPEGGTIPAGPPDKEGNPTTLTIELRSDAMEALPPGSTIDDPFKEAYHAYDALPMIQLLMSLMAEHGVAPIFKGMPPGAAGSGYRDNSLYAMAKSQFQYLLDSFQTTIAEFLNWIERAIVEQIDQEVWCDEYSLSPSDITDWPATITVEVRPSLPANFIATGEFYDRMHTQGHITRHRVREKGIGIEQPDEEEFEKLLEDLQEALKPMLIEDVIESVFVRPGQPAPAESEINDTPLLDQFGNPMRRGGIGGAQQVLSQNGNGAGPGRPIGRELGGFATGGRSRVPADQPGSFPPRMQERRS